MLIEKIRETVCLVKFENQLVSPLRLLLPDYSTTYTPTILSDDIIPASGGTVITLNRERWLIPEVMFHPEIAGISECGVSEAAVRAIQAAPEKLRHLISRRIILCGGIAKTPGFVERFTEEVKANIPSTWKFQVMTEPDGRTDLSVYRGAVALASSEETLSTKFNRAEYLG
jgi:actin-related protein 6